MSDGDGEKESHGDGEEDRDSGDSGEEEDAIPRFTGGCDGHGADGMVDGCTGIASGGGSSLNGGIGGGSVASGDVTKDVDAENGTGCGDENGEDGDGGR